MGAEFPPELNHQRSLEGKDQPVNNGEKEPDTPFKLTLSRRLGGVLLSLASSREAKTEEKLLMVGEDIFERCSRSESISAMVLPVEMG